MDKLNIALVQTDLHWQNAEKNMALFNDLLNDVKNADVIVLPEMFATGFTMEAKKYATKMDGPEVVWMQKMATEKDACVTGSLVIEASGNFYNRLFWVFPNGEIKTYDKRHLFTLAGEEKVYTAGAERLLVEYKNWRIMPLVCYDLRFPVWCRNDVNYDALIFVANWPERRSFHWQQLLKARAIENQSFVIGVNRVGDDGNGVYHSGNSAAIDPLGEEISELKPGEVRVAQVELQKETIKNVRQKFAFLADRDAFEIKNID